MDKATLRRSQDLMTRVDRAIGSIERGILALVEIEQDSDEMMMAGVINERVHQLVYDALHTMMPSGIRNTFPIGITDWRNSARSHSERIVEACTTHEEEQA